MTDPTFQGQLYGVMVKINQSGILIIGKPGIGKSSLALELLHHGHQLIADDNVDYQQQDNAIIASCPSLLKGQLHTRELGLINVPTLFGDNAIIDKCSLDLVIELTDQINSPTSIEAPQHSYSINNHSRPLLKLCIKNPASCYHRLITWISLLENPTANKKWLQQHQQALVNINS